jgi:hypothetical protein
MRIRAAIVSFIAASLSDLANAKESHGDFPSEIRPEREAEQPEKPWVRRSLGSGRVEDRA